MANNHEIEMDKVLYQYIMIVIVIARIHCAVRAFVIKRFNVVD